MPGKRKKPKYIETSPFSEKEANIYQYLKLGTKLGNKNVVPLRRAAGRKANAISPSRELPKNGTRYRAIARRYASLALASPEGDH
jgi:hypothetical protein